MAGRSDYKWITITRTLKSLRRVPDWLFSPRTGICRPRLLHSEHRFQHSGNYEGRRSGKRSSRSLPPGAKRWKNSELHNGQSWPVVDVAIPNPQWAQKVFPQETPEIAVEKLWDAILASVRIQPDQDPIALWETHNWRLSGITTG